MQWKSPKNTKEFYWTNHAIFKMRCYGLSAQKILGVIKKPTRKEEGIVKNTIAVMQPVNPKIINGKKIWKQEMWVMYQNKIKNQKSKVKSEFKNTKYRIPDTKYKIISAWRYPGVSPKINPIPNDILEEIKDAI